MRQLGVLLVLFLAGAPLQAQPVSTPARTLKLLDDQLQDVKVVATTGWGDAITVVQQDRAGDRQYLQIAYPGGREVAAGNYWVRRSALMPQASCTSAPVTAREGDNRGGGNGAGTFCKPAQ